MTDAITAYAEDVVAGKVLAGKYHRLACARHLRDLARQHTADFPYVLEYERAERMFRFSARLRHYKGEFAGRYIELQPYQKFRLGSVFAWVHRDTKFRRFRTAYNEIPRKGGKSLEAAVVAIYVTFFDGEPGAEGYCVAMKREQAKIVWNDAAKLVRSSGLRSRIRVLAANMHRESTASKLEPLGADKDSVDGLHTHLVIVDEFHAQKTRGLLDVMETSTGARRQPLNFQITTAGEDMRTPCGDQHAYTCNILDGVIQDETFFGFIAHADPEDLIGDGWLEETTWRKSNPMFGVSVRADDLRSLATKARHMQSARNAFLQKRLNVWVNATAPWLSLEGWRAGQRHQRSDGSTRSTEAWLAELKGQPCWLGVDLSSKIDLASVSALFPPKDARKHYCAYVMCFTPEDTLADRARRDRAPYLEYVKLGHLKTCPGNRLDQDLLRDHVLELRRQFDVQMVGFDPWNAGTIEKDLADEGFQVVEVPQTLREMSQPSKEFEADVLDGLVDANGNPLLELMVANVVVQVDGKDNIYPTKKKSRGRIDGVIATVIARKVAGVETKPEPTFQMFVLGTTAGATP